MPETRRVQRLLAPSRGTHTYWVDKDPVIYEGVIGLTKDRLFPGSLEYFIGDGVHKYSELPKYGGAEASILSKAYTLVLRDADGKIDSSSIDFPDATPTAKGVVKASTTTAGDNVVKADSNGSLDGWSEAIANAVADPNAGLVVGSGGKLGVDFDRMPTDKFEALLKSLKMLVPLTSNMDLYVSVDDPNAGDSIIDGRGTRAKPFKTIQACVNFVTSTYAVNSYRVSIRVVAGTYNENVTLPEYSRTTGYIRLITDSEERDVIVNAQLNSYGTRGTCFNVSGGLWKIYYFDSRRVENATTQKSQTPGIYHVSGGTLDIYGCAARQSMPNGVTTLDTTYYSVCLFRADNGGKLRLYHAKMDSIISCEKPASGAPAVTAIVNTRNSEVWLARDRDDENTPVTTPNYNCSGSCTTFYASSGNSKLYRLSGGTDITFVNNNVTGKRYQLETGSTGLDNLATDYFPGDEAGTFDASTYCWYTTN